MGRGIMPETCNYRGNEQGKGIEGAVTAHVDDCSSPGLPVTDSGPDVGHLEFFMFGTRLFVQFEPSNDTSAVILTEESGIVGKVMHKVKREESNEESSKAFKDEDPSPSRFAAYSVHLDDRSCKETTERACNSSRRKEDSGTNTKLGSSVPT